jgi:hypothetical protein
LVQLVLIQLFLAQIPLLQALLIQLWQVGQAEPLEAVVAVETLVAVVALARQTKATGAETASFTIQPA